MLFLERSAATRNLLLRPRIEEADSSLRSE